MFAAQRKSSSVSTWVFGAWAVITLVAAFYFGSEDQQPGEFFISRQSLWNDGRYYVKFTFLVVWLTLFDLVAVPTMLGVAIHALATFKPGPVEPPPTWDSRQLGHKVKQSVLTLVLAGLWGPYTGLALFAPEKLQPISIIAGVLLMSIPLVPLLVPAVVADVLLPIRYTEGTLDSLVIEKRGNNVVAEVTIGDDSFTTTPAKVAAVKQGQRVGCLRSGFFNTVLRLSPLSAEQAPQR